MKGGEARGTRGKGRGSPPRPARQVRPRGRPRTGEPLHPALAEFLEAVGHMAADAVLAKYRESGELASTSIKSPGGFYREGKAPGEGEDGDRFAQAKGRVRTRATGGSCDGQE